MKFKPSSDRIIIQRAAQAEAVRGGIIIPGTAQEKPLEGVVVAVGNGRLYNGKRTRVPFKEGDHVLFSKHVGSEIKVEGQDYIIMREDDVLGTLR